MKNGSNKYNDSFFGLPLESVLLCQTSAKVKATSICGFGTDFENTALGGKESFCMRENGAGPGMHKGPTQVMHVPGGGSGVKQIRNGFFVPIAQRHRTISAGIHDVIYVKTVAPDA